MRINALHRPASSPRSSAGAPGRWPRALVAALLLGVVACGGDDPAPVEDTAEPADTVAPDTAEPIDTATPDTAEADTVAPDTATPDTVEADTAEVDTTPPTSFPLACTQHVDCEVACASGRCEDERCAFTAPQSGCVIADDAGTTGECVDALAIDPGGSACLFCNPNAAGEGYTSVALLNDFESGTSGMTLERLTETPATWGVTSRRAASGTSSLYFGHPTEATYDVGARAAGRATTAPLTAPEGVELTLTFELWLDTEQTPAFDFLRVLVDRGTDAEPLELWHSDELGGTTFGEFLPVQVPLGVMSAGARVVFEFDSVDEIINGFEGAYIDSVRVTTGCCAEDGDCSDADRCTADRCEAGACVFEAIEGCCLLASDCADGDLCTRDECPVSGESCDYPPIFGCCHVDADCDDGDPCTRDVCPEDGAQCVNQPLCCSTNAQCDDGDPCTAGTCADGECGYVNACCEGPEDCDDGDSCTADSCVGTTCRHAFTFVAGCCRPNVMTQRFDSGVAGWQLSGATSNVGWRVLATPEAQSGTSALYYGHPTLNYYDTGAANQGTATSTSFQLPLNVDARVTMRVLLDVEASLTRDVFAVEALVGAEVIPIVTKAEVAIGSWQAVTADVSYLAGQTIRLRFRFDTVDALSNSTRGVYVDDVRVLSSCQPRACETEASCTSPVECISGTCDDGGCAYGGGC